METYECPVCRWKMDEPASDYNICEQCGTEFGYDDCFTSHKELRDRWIKNGRKFWYKTTPEPK